LKITCTRRLQYAIGHRVHRHESKCRNLHGHNFVFHLTAEAELDDLGRVIDFAVLKERVGGWIEDKWDHGFVLWSNDKEAMDAVSAVEGQKLYPLPYNPTAENLARYVLERVGPAQLCETRVRLVGVTVQETENGSAEATL